MKNILLSILLIIFFVNFSFGGGVISYYNRFEISTNHIILVDSLRPPFLVDLSASPKNILVAFLYFKVDLREYTFDPEYVEFYRIEKYDYNPYDSIHIDKYPEPFSSFSDFRTNGFLFREGTLDSTITIQEEAIQITECYYLITEYNYNKFLLTKSLKSKYSSNTTSYFDVTEFKRNGIFKQYYSSGVLKEEKIFKDGILSDGVSSFYHPNGQFSHSFTLKNGLLQDTTYRYDPDANLISYIVFKDGEIIERFPEENNEPDLKKKALLIAVGEYSNHNPITDYEVDWDIHYIKKMLEAYQFPESNINILKNSKATAGNIKSNIDLLILNIKAGDVVYLHFATTNWKDYMIPYGVEFDYIYDMSEKEMDSIFIGKDYLLEKMEELRVAVGAAGQVVLVLDDGGSENIESESETNDTIVTSISKGFRSAIIDANKFASNTKKSPYIFLSIEGINMIISDKNGNDVGAMSYNLYRTLTKTPSFGFDDVKNFLMKFSAENCYTCGKLIAEGDLDIPVFESRPGLEPEEISLPPRGNAWVLSVGISEYNYNSDQKIPFDNCVTDAKSFFNFFKYQYRDILRNTSEKLNLHNKILLNETATKDSIENAINYIGNNAQPNDYFIFNFSGYTKTLTDSSGKQTTWFVPYGLNNILDTAEIIEKGISLTKLKNLFQFIPANNQMFITEAGQSNDFHREFVKALIESNPTISSLTGRNRIIIVPKGYGRDFFICNHQRINHGPLNYFLTSLPAGLNIFQLFESGKSRHEIEFAFEEVEHNCNSFSMDYFHIFYEKDFTNDLKYYLSDEMISSNRVKLLQSEYYESIKEKAGNKHALIIGTDNFMPDTEWGKLANPVLDANTIAYELKTGFDYQVKLLEDPPLDSIYKHLIYYARVLDTSDQFILFVAGHGDFYELLDDGMIVCSDSKSTREDQARNSYIQYSKLTRLINNLPSKQILVILDVCFGGTFDYDVARSAKRNKEYIYDDLINDDYLQRKLKYTTRLFISSGGKKEVPDGYKGKHSPFAYKIIEALRSRGGEFGMLTASDMFQFVQKLPSEPIKNGFGDDEPGSEFLLIRAQKEKTK